MPKKEKKRNLASPGSNNVSFARHCGTAAGANNTIHMLKQKIQSDATSALKEGNKEIADVLRFAVSSINNKEKEKRYKIAKEAPDLKEEELNKKSELTNDEAVSVLSAEIKKRKDAIALYEKGGRQELADKEKQEIEILQKYLPEQLSEDELKKLIEESIKNVGAQTIKDMGKVMADLAPKIKGKADGKEASEIVKEILS